MKKQGPTIKCWELIGYGWKGPFHVWETGTEEERKEAEFWSACINAEMAEELDRAKAEWSASPEWLALREQELKVARCHGPRCHSQSFGRAQRHRCCGGGVLVYRVRTT